jgi:hypothetical protein
MLYLVSSLIKTHNTKEAEMAKTIKKLKVGVRVRKEKTVQKEKLPSRETARLPVLLQGFKDKEVKLDKEVNLETLKIGGKLFGDLISSRAVIGRTTRKGLALAGIYCKAVKVLPNNKQLWSSVIFTRKK